MMNAQMMRVDPSLPCVSSTSLVCPHCGQSYVTVMDGEPSLPDRHYVEPTLVEMTGRKRGLVIRTVGCKKTTTTQERMCPVDRDVLVALIYRAQRELAGIGIPRLLRENACVEAACR